MTSMKTMMISILDVGSSMNEPIHKGKKFKKIEMAKTFIGNYVMQRMMASKTFEFGLVTYGSSATKNFLNDNQGGYENVEEVLSITRPNIDSLNEINKVQSSQLKGDLIDGIIVGQDLLIRTNEKKAFNRLMLLVTDGETIVEGIEDLASVLGSMAQTSNFGFYLAMIGKIDESSSHIKKENAKFLKSMTQSLGGKYLEIESVADSFYLLSSGPGLKTRPQLSKTFFEIGSLSVPCNSWDKVMKAKYPSLKKLVVSESSPLIDGIDSFGVKRDLSYRNPDDLEEEIFPEERIKGYKYGPQYIPITPTDEEMFKINGNVGIQLLGFMPKENIPRHHYLSVTTIVQSMADSEWSRSFFHALVSSMRSMGQAGLVRVTKRQNADPYLACIIPTQANEVEDYHCLIMHRLPMNEDVREYAFPSLLRFSAAALASPDHSTLERQMNAMSDFVDALTMKPPVSKSDISPYNPSLHAIYATAYNKLLEIPEEARIVIQDPMTLPGELNLNSSLLESLREQFPLKKLTSKSNKRKIYWSDIEINSKSKKSPTLDTSQLNTLAIQESIYSQIESKTSEDTQDTIDLPDFSVGSITPIDDFKELINKIIEASPEAQKTALLNQAIGTMVDIVDRNIQIGASNAHYKRAMNCLKALREVCVQQAFPDPFNHYLCNKFKPQYASGRHTKVWELIVSEELTLISSNEVASSSHSAEEASSFLRELDKPPTPEKEAEPANEEEDLFGDML